ncbi:MAG: hypothetical protein ACYTGZ_08855 [Planctomycetota bacterium]|jgi:hypothetical protein
MVKKVQDIRRFTLHARNIACVCALMLFVACGNSSPTKQLIDEISQERAEQVRDGCVGDALGLLHALADRLAPLARAGNPEQLALTAARVGCSIETTTDGYRLLCPAMDLRDATLAVELHLRYVGDSAVLTVTGADLLRRVDGTLTLRDDPDRGLVMEGGLEAVTSDGCRAVAEFDEVVGLEALDSGSDGSRVFFRAGAVDLSVYAEDDERLAHGSAALAGRDAFVVLNFAEFSLLGELRFD